jgi:hypothetical protein
LRASVCRQTRRTSQESKAIPSMSSFAPGRHFRIGAPAGVRVSFASLAPAEADSFAADLASCLRQRHVRAD